VGRDPERSRERCLELFLCKGLTVIVLGKNPGVGWGEMGEERCALRLTCKICIRRAIRALYPQGVR